MATISLRVGDGEPILPVEYRDATRTDTGRRVFGESAVLEERNPVSLSVPLSARQTMRPLLLFCLILLTPAAHAQGKRPMKIEDLFQFKRVSEPQISPDGRQVIYVVGTVDG